MRSELGVGWRSRVSWGPGKPPMRGAEKARLLMGWPKCSLKGHTGSSELVFPVHQVFLNAATPGEMHLSTIYYMPGSVPGAVHSNGIKYTKDSSVVGTEVSVMDQVQSTGRSQRVER